MWNKLQSLMIERTYDKIPIIRCYAVIALSRLQDPTEKDNPIIQEYLRLLSSDSSR